jgi:hypothetical protein
MVVLPAPVGDLERLTPREWHEVLRQLSLPRRGSVGHEHRDDPDLGPRERGRHLDADEVVRIVQPAPSRVVHRGNPVGADDDDQDAAGADGVLDVIDEVDAGSIVSMSMKTRLAPNCFSRRS